MVLAVEVATEVIAGLVAIFCVFLTGAIAAMGWTVSLLWRTSNTLSRVEERIDDLERRLERQEAT